MTLNTQKQFEQKLKKDGKEVSKLTERQREILFKGYKVRIRKSLKKLSEQNREIYENLDEYLNGNTEDTVRKITNRKRFNEVLASLETASNSYERYMQIIQLEILNLFKGVDTEFVNIFTRINNLFIKRDSTNALSMLDSTREEDGTVLTDRRLAESTIFDKIDMGLLERKGEYVIQGASERMIVSGIQRRILEFVYRNR